MGGRPSKPANLIVMEGKSHRTKKELATRKAAENSLLTGKAIHEAAEVKNNPVAHREFTRLKKLLKAIDKNDDLYGAAINRYCTITSECVDLEQQLQDTNELIEEFKKDKKKFLKTGSLKEWYTTLSDMQSTALKLNTNLEKKRQMLFAIEKENCMTVSSSLRSIPKKPETKTNALKEALYGNT